MMFYNLSGPKCSQCQSTDREQFQQAGKDGIRCLKCGHEKVTVDRTQAHFHDLPYNHQHTFEQPETF